MNLGTPENSAIRKLSIIIIIIIIAFCRRVSTWVCVWNRLYCGGVHAVAFCHRVSTWAVARNSGWVWLEQSTVMPTSISLTTHWARWTPTWENTSSRRWLEPGGCSDTRSASLSISLSCKRTWVFADAKGLMICLSVCLSASGIGYCRIICLSHCLQVELGVAGCWKPDYMPECLSVCKWN